MPMLSSVFRNLSDASTDLKAILADKIPKEQERVKNFRKEYGSTVVGDVTVDMVRTLFHFHYLLFHRGCSFCAL